MWDLAIIIALNEKAQREWEAKQGPQRLMLVRPPKHTVREVQALIDDGFTGTMVEDLANLEQLRQSDPRAGRARISGRKIFTEPQPSFVCQ